MQSIKESKPHDGPNSHHNEQGGAGYGNLTAHPASFSNVRDASSDTGVGPESRCKIVFKKRGWFQNGHRQVGSSFHQNVRFSLTTSLKPLTLRRSNDGAKSAHSHEISLVSRLPNAPSLTINTEARSSVEQIKAGGSRPGYIACSYHIKSHQLLQTQQSSQIHNSTINATIPNHQPNLKLS
jgi:hypothetical protein